MSRRQAAIKMEKQHMQDQIAAIDGSASPSVSATPSAAQNHAAAVKNLDAIQKVCV